MTAAAEHPAREDDNFEAKALLLRLSGFVEQGRFADALPVLGALARSSANEPTGFRFLSAAELRAPLEPVPYLIEALDICPGRPTQITGTGFAGKTTVAQSLMTSIIVGRPVWGRFDCRKGPCVHLDYEMGRRPLLSRYRRLATGMGVVWETDVAPHLHLAPLPKLYLNSPGVEQELRRVAEGKSLVVVDSLRRALPGANENDSAISEYIDVMTHVSEATGTPFIFLHHSTTKRMGEDTDPRGAGRGSSAIFDASGAVLSLSGRKGEPILVTQTKAPERGTAADDFNLVIRDVEIEGDPRAGLLVEYRPVTAKTHSDHVMEMVCAVVRAAGPEGVAGKDAIRTLVGKNGKKVRDAVDAAIQKGLIRNNATLKGGAPDEQHPRYVTVAPAAHSSRPLRTGRVSPSSADESDESDEGNES